MAQQKRKWPRSGRGETGGSQLGIRGNHLLLCSCSWLALLPPLTAELGGFSHSDYLSTQVVTWGSYQGDWPQVCSLFCISNIDKEVYLTGTFFFTNERNVFLWKENGENLWCLDKKNSITPDQSKINIQYIIIIQIHNVLKYTHLFFLFFSGLILEVKMKITSICFNLI